MPSSQDNETAIILNNNFPFSDNHDSIIIEKDDTTEYDSENNDDEAIVPAPITQELNLKPTGQPYKLTFYYENDKQENQQTTEIGNHNSNHHGNYDGLIVQSYDNSAESSKTGR